MVSLSHLAEVDGPVWLLLDDLGPVLGHPVRVVVRVGRRVRRRVGRRVGVGRGRSRQGQQRDEEASALFCGF